MDVNKSKTASHVRIPCDVFDVFGAQWDKKIANEVFAA